nr:heavy-metal-associated domain-containing protein [uncultured Pedobacter sp.]
METLKFKTNIKCSGCIATVTPHLNNLSGVDNWNVDTQNPEKILTIESESGLESQKVVETLKGAGYTAEKL